jgi:hypothetical protein
MTDKDLKQIQYYQGWLKSQVDHMEVSADEAGKKKAADVKATWDALDKLVDDLIRERYTLWNKLVRIQGVLDEVE